MGRAVCSSGELGVDEESEGDPAGSRGAGGEDPAEERGRGKREAAGGARGSRGGPGPAAARQGAGSRSPQPHGPTARAGSGHSPPRAPGSHRPRLPASSDPPRQPSPRCGAQPRPLSGRPLAPASPGREAARPLCTPGDLSAPAPRGPMNRRADFIFPFVGLVGLFCSVSPARSSPRPHHPWPTVPSAGLLWPGGPASAPKMKGVRGWARPEPQPQRPVLFEMCFLHASSPLKVVPNG